MAPQRVWLWLAPLLALLLLAPASCFAQSRWKTGSDAGGAPCIYLYKCIQADGTYASVYAGQAGNCAGRLGEHTGEFGKYDQLTRTVSLVSAVPGAVGSVLDVLPVENNRDMFEHEACILKKCMAGAAARTAVVAARTLQRTQIQQANALLPLNAPQQPLPPALAFDPADAMQLSIYDPRTLVPGLTTADKLNAAERWLVALIEGNTPASQNRAICNRKMGGNMGVPAWVPGAVPNFIPLVDTSNAIGAVPDMTGMRTNEFNGVLTLVAQRGQTINTHVQTIATQTQQINALTLQVQQLTAQLQQAQQGLQQCQQVAQQQQQQLAQWQQAAQQHQQQQQPQQHQFPWNQQHHPNLLQQMDQAVQHMQQQQDQPSNGNGGMRFRARAAAAKHARTLQPDAAEV